MENVSSQTGQPSKLESSTGNGQDLNTPTENDTVPTVEPSEPSPSNTDTELVNSMNEAPTTATEALGLLQTRFFDLQSLKLSVMIEGDPDTGELFAVISFPGHKLGFEGGHILIDKKPVVTL